MNFRTRLLMHISVTSALVINLGSSASADESPSREPAAAIPEKPYTPPTFTTKPTDEELFNLVQLFSGINIKGSIDAYYTHNFNRLSQQGSVPTTADSKSQNKYHVFDTQQGDMQFSYARFQIQKVTSKVTTTLDLAYGPAMQVLSGTRTDAGQLNVKQALIAYKPDQYSSIEFGRFISFLGFETVESQDNWNYSRSTLFGYFAPFWNQGAKASYQIHPTLTVLGSVMNGWNNSYEDNKEKCYGGQVAWNPNSDFSIYLSVISGRDALPTSVNASAAQENRTVYDVVSTLKATDHLSFALNIDQYDHGQFHALGAAIYSKYQFDDQWAVAGRYENIDDSQNLVLAEQTGGGQHLSTYTLTIEDKVSQNLTFKLEGRVDSSSRNVFPSESGNTNQQTVGTFGVVGSF